MRRYAPEESPAKLKAESTVAFEWSCQSPDINATYLHKMLCRMAVYQQVPFPSHWRTAIPFVADIQKLIQDATAHASRKAENSIVTCELLGIPVDDDRLDALCGDGSGSLVTLQGANMEVPRDFLLVAHVHEDTWICHSGSNANGLIDEVSVFDLKDLEANNIRQESLPEDAVTSRTRRRITRKQPARDLLNAAGSNPSAWSTARAYALWLAEEIRANGRLFQLHQARAGFESNPFQWGGTEHEWFSRTQIGFLWSWQCRGQLRHTVSFVRLNHLFEPERHIPRPEALKGPWEIWQSRLEYAAAKHFACKYLGVKVGRGFEPDPEKWKVGNEQRKESLTAWYEWEHVTRGAENEPYRVGLTVANIVHHNRQVPHHPCSRSCPRKLRFDLKYMEGMASWKSTGGQYVGISYESDRPVFQCELPDGGMDIQEHPVYWHFANGVEMYTLRELFALNENHFELHSDDDEPYEMIGESMGWVPLGICENEVHLAEYDLIRSLCF